MASFFHWIGRKVPCPTCRSVPCMNCGKKKKAYSFAFFRSRFASLATKQNKTMVIYRTRQPIYNQFSHQLWQFRELENQAQRQTMEAGWLCSLRNKFKKMLIIILLASFSTQRARWKGLHSPLNAGCWWRVRLQHTSPVCNLSTLR